MWGWPSVYGVLDMIMSKRCEQRKQFTTEVEKRDNFMFNNAFLAII